MWDIAFEIIAMVVMSCLAGFILWFGRREGIQGHGSWRLITAGALLLFIGSVFDLTDNFETLNRFVIIGDTPYEAFLEKVIGRLLAYGLLLVGIWRWLPERAEKLRREVEERKRVEKELKRVHGDLLLAEERERRSLAVDLHDGLNQTIALAQMKLASQLENADGDLEISLKEIKKLIDDVNQAARSLTYQLSPPILHDLGFEPAVQWLTEDIQDSYGLEIELLDDGEPMPLDERVRVLLFRAVRELLINVAKHARATKTYVRLERNGGFLNIAVEDDGVAFDTAAQDGRGLGLSSIRERLSDLGGRMEIHSKPGHGTVVRLVVPLISEEP
ncbi:MAG: sensor histidine kinase [Planctomycetota bacterium]